MGKPEDQELREKLEEPIETLMGFLGERDSRDNWWGYDTNVGTLEDQVDNAIDSILALIHQRDTDRDIASRKPMWYICTDFFRNGGQIVMGGFETQSLALKVRHMYEKQTSGRTFAVDKLTAQQSKEKSND